MMAQRYMFVFIRANLCLEFYSKGPFQVVAKRVKSLISLFFHHFWRVKSVE